MRNYIFALLLVTMGSGCRVYTIQAAGPRPGTMLGTSHNALFTSNNDQIVLCTDQAGSVDCEDVPVSSPIH